MATAIQIESNAIDQPHIEKLPDEVLAIIFLLNTFKRSGAEPLNHNPLATTLSTLLVCKRWQDVATNYPSLWSQLIDYEKHSVFWVGELLRRSKSSLIDVGEDSVFKFVQLRHGRSKDILASLFENRSRIRTLNIQIRLQPWNLISKNFLQHPSPSLEYLNLVTSCPFPDCLFPDPLFAGQAPRLRSVHLQRCLIDFTSIALANLTELSVLDILAPGILSLRKPDHPLKVAPTVALWLRILEHIPSLQYLTLSNAMTASDPDESLPTIHLPKLSFLTIGASFEDGVSLLHHITIPQQCGIRVRLSCKARPALDGTNLLSFLSDHLSHWPLESPDRYLQAKILSGDRIHFGNSKRVGYIWDMTEADVIAEHSMNSADPLIWLVLSLDSSEDTVTLFNKLLSLYAPTYPTTTTLDLWLDEEFADIITTPATFPSLSTLHSFTAVRTLNLLERSPLYLLPLFKHSSLPNKPLFPALRSLRLTRTNFDDDGVTYSTIMDFLHWRKEVDMPLTDLQIIESKIREDTKEDLSSIGGVKVMLGYLTVKAIDYSLREMTLAP